MPIVNRDLDASQQRDILSAVLNVTPSAVSAGIANPGLSTGNTFRICTVPYPATLKAVQTSVWGLSGAPNHSLWIYRFAGGFTSIQVGASFAVTAFGTSGSLSYSLYAAATFPLQTGDQIVLNTTGANTAVAEANFTVVLQALQDIKTTFGV